VGLERSRAVRVYRPDVLPVRTEPAPGNAQALSSLGEPIRVMPAARKPAPSPATAASPPASAPLPNWKRVDDALGSAETQLRAANFEAALSTAERVRRQLGGATSAEGARARQARAEVVAATAEIALGREAAAQRSFQRALSANPTLSLDPATTSPKVRRALDAARSAKGGTP
jgi:hypothetical protein